MSATDLRHLSLEILTPSHRSSTLPPAMYNGDVPDIHDYLHVNQRARGNTRAQGDAQPNRFTADDYEDINYNNDNDMRTMEERVASILSVSRTLNFPFMQKTSQGNWKRYAETQLQELHNPSKGLRRYLTTIAAAMSYLSPIAYMDERALVACEILASLMSFAFNAAREGGTPRAYAKWELVMPLLTQSSSALAHVPPENLREIQKQAKYLDEFDRHDSYRSSSNNKRRYDEYSTNSNRSQERPNNNRPRQAGSYNNSRYNNNNPNGSRPTHNNASSGSSSAAAQQ